MSKTAPTRLAMKLTLLMLFVVMLSAQAESNAQTVSISGRNITLKQLFSAHQETNRVRCFRQRGIDPRLQACYHRCAKYELRVFAQADPEPQGLTFEIKEKNEDYSLIEKKKQEKNIAVQNLLIDNSTYPISGRIVDQDGQPLEGASVRIRGYKIRSDFQC